MNENFKFPHWCGEDCDYVGIEHLVCLAEQLRKGGKQ